MIQVTKHGQENEISDKENDSDCDEDDCDEDDNDLDDLDLSLVEDHEESGVTTHLSDSYCSEAEDCLSDSSETCLESDSHSETTESSDEIAVLYTASPPTTLEPAHHIAKIQRMTSTVVPKSFRICGDNIDKTVRPRFLRSDRKNESLHYFHSYAVQNRVNVSSLSDLMKPNTSTPENIAQAIFPSKSDDKCLRQNIAVLISRVLVSYLSFLGFSFDKVVEWHIEHQYSQEMSQKSVVVS